MPEEKGHVTQQNTWTTNQPIRNVFHEIGGVTKFG